MSWLNLLLAQVSGQIAQSDHSDHSDHWSQVFFGLDDGQRFVLMIIAIGCSTAVIITVSGIAAGVYTTVRKRRQDMELKQEMLDRGMSAEEIAEVIKAAPVEDGISRWVESWSKKKKSH